MLVVVANDVSHVWIHLDSPLLAGKEAEHHWRREKAAAAAAAAAAAVAAVAVTRSLWLPNDQSGGKLAKVVDSREINL